MFIRSIKSSLQRQYSFVQTISLTPFSSCFSCFNRLLQSPAAQPAIAKQHLKKQNAASNYPLLMAIATVIVFGSCQKERLNDPALNSTVAGNTDEAKLKLSSWLHKDPVSYYGAYIGVPDSVVGDKDFQLSVADQLNIYCLRERVLVPAKSFDFDLVPELSTDYKVLLNFDSPSPEDGSLTPFVTDLTQYKIDLNTILSTFAIMPEVAVIENEESNRFYYSGSSNDYIDQLNTAIPIMHARGIKVTNGGITSSGLSYLVYQDLLTQGKEDSAEMFKEITDLTPNSVALQNRGEVVDTLLTAYSTMNLDYVNFHWKASSPDTQAFNQVINYLKKRTGKKIINNELGQFDTDPNTLLSHVQLCTDQDLPYILWYSPDEHDGKKGKPLHYSDASLTPSGFAYQDYLANKD